MPPAAALVAAYRRLTDPRHRRGTRHPLGGLLSVVSRSLLSRHSDFAPIARWARRHWPTLIHDPVEGVGFWVVAL